VSEEVMLAGIDNLKGKTSRKTKGKKISVRNTVKLFLF